MARLALTLPATTRMPDLAACWQVTPPTADSAPRRALPGDLGPQLASVVVLTVCIHFTHLSPHTFEYFIIFLFVVHRTHCWRCICSSSGQRWGWRQRRLRWQRGWTWLHWLRGTRTRQGALLVGTDHTACGHLRSQCRCGAASPSAHTEQLRAARQTTQEVFAHCAKCK